MMKHNVLLPLAAFAVAIGMFFSGVAVAGWEPKKPVDFVIMAGKGGGADKMARLMQSVIEKHGLSSKPFVPINKPGGSGAEALLHLKGKSGDNHTVMVTLNSGSLSSMVRWMASRSQLGFLVVKPCRLQSRLQDAPLSDQAVV